MSSLNVNAQTELNNHPIDEILEPSDTLNQVENFITDVADSVVLNPTVVNIIPEAKIYPDFPDSVYRNRLMALSTPMNLTYNDQVDAIIKLYVFRKREQVERMLGLSQIYFPIFEEVMRDSAMPEDIKYLAVIESALNPSAVSRVGATGMWQFMYGTAKMYGLKVNHDIDERRDIYKSTQAAACYLKRSYEKYGDWFLAIASYNCGPGNVDKAIYRSGGKRDFWSIMNYLPKETRGYVPAFIAAMYVMNYYHYHDLYPKYPDMKFCEISSVPVTDKICFEKLCMYTNSSVEDIKFLNPGLNSNIIPAWNDPYVLRMPSSMLPIYDAMKDSIVASSKYEIPKYSFSSKFYTTGSSKVHIVKKGETLGSIAARNRVTVSQIKKWNHLNSNIIRVGQRLKLNGVSYVSSTPKTTSTSTGSVSSNSSTNTTSSGKVIYYKVRSGDTLWSIAKKYKGLTIDEIKASNSPTKTNSLKAGVTLKLVL